MGETLLTANWAIGLLPLLGLTWIVVTRVGREEDAMTAKFGDGSRRYMASTGRFLPRLEMRAAAG